MSECNFEDCEDLRKKNSDYCPFHAGKVRMKLKAFRMRSATYKEQ